MECKNKHRHARQDDESDEQTTEVNEQTAEVLGDADDMLAEIDSVLEENEAEAELAERLKRVDAELNPCGCLGYLDNGYRRWDGPVILWTSE